MPDGDGDGDGNGNGNGDGGLVADWGRAMMAQGRRRQMAGSGAVLQGCQGVSPCGRLVSESILCVNPIANSFRMLGSTGR